MGQYHTVKVDGGLYVPLSHWETVVADRDKWKKMYEELVGQTKLSNPERIEQLHNEIVRLVSNYND